MPVISGAAFGGPCGILPGRGHRWTIDTSLRPQGSMSMSGQPLADSWNVRLLKLVTQEGDTHEEGVAKITLLIISMVVAVAASFWSLTYWLLERPLSASIPGGYAVISALSIAFFLISKRHTFFRFSQIFLILLLPFLLQWSLGGFSNSSHVSLWSFLAILGALMFHGVKPSLWWYLAFVALLLASGFLDPQLSEQFGPLPQQFQIGFAVGNTLGVSIGLFLAIRYYITRNQKVLGEVRQRTLEAEQARAVAEQAHATIAEQAEKLRDLDRLKTQFFANISHELRTPLTLLLGPIQRVLEHRDRLDDDSSRHLTLAARNGRRLLRQINMLLDFTKADAGHMELELAYEDPVALARNVVEESQPAAQARNIHIAFEGSPDRTEPMELDPHRMDQVLLNLVGNALKFTPDGGRITVGVAVSWGSVEYRVSDTGIGIPESELPHLFQVFRQVRRDRSQINNAASLYRQEQQGTGLGLALVKQIVDLHRGRIEVDSQEGVGTTFIIILPRGLSRADTDQEAIVKQDDAMPVDVSAEMEAPASASNLHADLERYIEDGREAVEPEAPAPVVTQGTATGYRLLVVDDNADVRMFVRGLLQSKYIIQEASDGEEGIQRAIANPPDLIISDVMMPRKSGFELVYELKTNPATRSIPIILLTARGGTAAESLRVGADDYLAKPFDPNELDARVLALLRITQLEREVRGMHQQLASEMDAARKVQESFMPRDELRLTGFNIAGMLVPATQLAGDYYDFFPSHNGRLVGIAIGDVMGHGASSALVTAVAKTALTSHSPMLHPNKVLTGLGHAVWDALGGLKHMTCFYGLLDAHGRRLRFANAGHTMPVVYSHRQNTVTAYPLPGQPIGVSREVSYVERELVLEPGDVCVLYSDGLVEATHTESARTYGMRRLASQIRRTAGLQARDMAEALINDVGMFTGRAFEDDATAVIIKTEPQISGHRA
jgi:signal transduction histidine kinase/serine phosphatase RsbU (regulator of sigma subunit)